MQLILYRSLSLPKRERELLLSPHYIVEKVLRVFLSVCIIQLDPSVDFLWSNAILPLVLFPPILSLSQPDGQ